MQLVGGGEAFTLAGSGQDAAGSEKVGNGVTGDYTLATTGSDTYTLVESGSTGSGSFTATVSGVDDYTTSEAGNTTQQSHLRTTTGEGTYDRTVSGSGTTLSSGSGTNSYTLTEAGDERAGHFEQAKFGENRYDLLPLFADVSNAVDGANPGHVTFYTHGLPFRDPNALTRWLDRRGENLRDAANWVGDKLSDLDDWLWDPNNPLGTVLMVAGLFNPMTAPLVISYGVAKFGGIGFDRWGLDKQVAANNGWEGPTLVSTLADVYGEAGAAFGEGLGDGGVMYQVNQTKDGLVVLLMNNRGVDKTQHGIARVDRRQFTDVVIRTKKPLKSAREWTGPRDLVPVSGKLTVRVHPGDVQVIGLVTK